jgi:LysM repeat protein
MFVVMLLLHVLVIGAIVLYDFVGDEEAPKLSPGAVAASKSATPARAVPLSPAAAVTAQQAAATSAPAATSSEFEIYEVKRGDTIASIITQLNVDRDEFLKMNSLLSDNIEIEPQSVLRVPKNKLPAPTNPAVVANSTPAATTAATVQDSTPPTTAAADEGATSAPNTVSMPVIPLSPEELVASISPPKDEPAPAKTTAAPVVQEKTPEPVKPKPAAMTPPRPVPTPSEMAKKPLVKNDPPASARKPEVTAKPVVKSGGKSYTLAKGDTLYRVAMKTGVSVNEIIRANNIKDPAKLRDGTKLVIPAK